MNKIFGVLLVVLALTAAVVPQFTTCESQGKLLTLASGMSSPMKCSWTAKAELATAVPLFAVGAIMSFSRRRETKVGLSVLGTILGIAVLLLPTSLIGVCSSNMLCNTVMKPVLLSAGSLVTAISLVSLAISVGVKGKVDEFSKVSHPKY